jgi:CheY-like chemotaxis protein
MSGRPSDRRPLVLFVDDTQEIRDLYVRALSRAGFRVAEAQDGVAAIVKAHALVPDVVVMDVGMAGLDGVEAARRLKAEARTHGIPVILFTGEPVDDRIRAAECAEIVQKPCSLHRLVDAVRRHAPK